MPRKSLTILTILVCIALLVLASAFMFGAGSRCEFSPDTLQARTQSEYLLPIIEKPIFHGPWSTWRWPLADYLVANHYWSPLENNDPRWLFVYQFNRQWRDGDSPLHRELVLRKDNWIQWTKDNPKLARHMWPRLLQQLRSDAQNHTYTTLDILTAARIANTPEEMDELLKP